MARHSLALLLIFTLAGITNAREYRLAQALPADLGDQTRQITLTLYPSAAGGQPLEVQQLANSQWRLDTADPDAPRLEGVIDTELPLPLWAEISVNDEPLATRAELNAPGDLTAEGEIFSKSGFRFPDNTVQTSAANTEAQAKVFGGSSSCPACQQGLLKYEQETGLKTDYIVMEIANRKLGENWQQPFVERLKTQGVEKVLL